MSDAELIQDLKYARERLHKESVKSVEECMFHYKRILLKAYNKTLTIDPMETPGGLISDLQNAGYLNGVIYRAITQGGKDFVEKEILIIK
jgi:hypothetical protein